MNKKVCHDVTYEDYPKFDLFQDIQFQNNLSTTQLNIIRYKGDVLKSQFTENTIWERQAALRLSQCPILANAKILLLLQIRACHLRQTCSKQQKSIGRLQRWWRRRTASIAGWIITSDTRPHCPSLSAW
jgi:hypothetical protein